MEGTAEILGDIVGPISSEQDWDAGGMEATAGHTWLILGV
jgi:hypothetical protein